jgi:hypothetical protein
MFTDAQIEEVRPAVEEFFGPTRAAWYADACRLEGPTCQADALMWACRCREMAREGARLAADMVGAIKHALTEYEDALEHLPHLRAHLMGTVTHPVEGRAYRDVLPDSGTARDQLGPARDR